MSRWVELSDYYQRGGKLSSEMRVKIVRIDDSLSRLTNNAICIDEVGKLICLEGQDPVAEHGYCERTTVIVRFPQYKPMCVSIDCLAIEIDANANP